MEAHRSDRPVVVGVDGSRSALCAVPWAAAEAVRRHVPLRLVTAYRGRQDIGSGELGPEHRARDIVLGYATGALAEATQLVERTYPRLAVQRELVVGSPISVLYAEMRTAQLLVVGHRGTGGIGGRSLGSVAEAMGRCAICPVVVFREEEGDRDPTRPVVVGVGDSSTSDAALTFAFDAAAGRGVGLIAVHTWWEPLLQLPLEPWEDRDAIAARERDRLDERLAPRCAKYPDVAVQRLVRRDLPAHALVERSRGAQLVVVGSRGRGWLAGLVLGSVGHTLMHRAKCPVAIVRAEIGAVA